MSKEKINFKHDSDFPDHEKYLNIPYDFSPFVVYEGVFYYNEIRKWRKGAER